MKARQRIRKLGMKGSKVENAPKDLKEAIEEGVEPSRVEVCRACISIEEYSSLLYQCINK